MLSSQKRNTKSQFIGQLWKWVRDEEAVPVSDTAVKLENKKYKKSWDQGARTFTRKLYSGRPEEIESHKNPKEYLTNAAQAPADGDLIDMVTGYSDRFKKQMWKVDVMYTNDYFTIIQYYAKDNRPQAQSQLKSTYLYLTAIKIDENTSETRIKNIKGKHFLFTNTG